MLGARNTSLLHKLGYQMAHEMPFADLCQLVTKAQSARSIARAVGRAQRMLADPSVGAIRKPKRPKSSPHSLSSLENFFTAEICVKLRAHNKVNGKTMTDFQIIQLLQQKGLL